VTLLTHTALSGLAFPECPRWHGGALYFSDQHDRRVVRFDVESGAAETVVEVDGQPSGLGWLPDGQMLVVSMLDLRVLRFDGRSLHEHANLSDVARVQCNDMVVDSAGRAYVGNFGFDFESHEAPRTTTVARVDSDGSVTVAADDLGFPNGMVISPDGRTLVVAESMAARLTAFTVDGNGGLSDRRVYAPLETAPDGICLDAEGAVWFAAPATPQCIRVSAGGEVLQRVDVGEGHTYACALGGHDRRTLFVCAAPTHVPAENVRLHEGRIEVVTVEVPGAGIP
jgi:sugar lactone lactonase YvrE